MIYQLYKKQVEAWKERWKRIEETMTGHISGRKIWNVDPEDEDGYRFVDDDLLSSHHKDTIELIEAEIERKRGMRKDPYGENAESYEEHKYFEGYDDAIDEDIAYLEEQIKLIKNEQ